MQAVVLTGVNIPLVVEEVDIPELEAGEALVKIKAAAFNRRDYWIQKGQYAGLKYPIILGSDGSGIVEKVASSSDHSWVGQEVVINPSVNWGESEAFQSKGFSILGLPQNGTFAEYVKINAENLHPKPKHLSFEEAAAFPLAGLTAFRALFSRASLKSGEKLLIVGVGGGVTSFALLMANAIGAEVYVTSGNPAKVEHAKSLGAIAGVNYRDENWAEQLKEISEGFDVIIDGALGSNFEHHLDLCNPGGRIVFYGGTAGNIPELNARKIFWKQLSILGTTMGSPRDFSNLLEFINEHKLKPIVDSVHSFKDAEQGIRMMDSSSQFGKIVLKMDS
jgi:NADPH:quinone reductase-like Zn-dependent oxidoreductase